MLLVALWIYNRSFVEGLSVVVVIVTALTLLIAIPYAHLSLPLRLAGNNEHRLVARASSGAYGFSGYEILGALLILAILVVVLAGPTNFSGLLDRFSWLLTAVVAVAATIAFFPYLHYIYPVPQNRDYYAETTHAMWLPAQRIQMNTRLVYYGYVLSSDNRWVTVLLVNSRLIAYLSAGNVVSRSVCDPKMPAQPKQYPPLVPWLYHPPQSIQACASQDEIALITSFLSRGEPLEEISDIVRIRPELIISITNAYQHRKLSHALRKYECRQDWNAPTPVGQNFWYYPNIVPY